MIVLHHALLLLILMMMISPSCLTVGCVLRAEAPIYKLFVRFARTAVAGFGLSKFRTSNRKTKQFSVRILVSFIVCGGCVGWPQCLLVYSTISNLKPSMYDSFFAFGSKFCNFSPYFLMLSISIGPPRARSIPWSSVQVNG